MNTTAARAAISPTSLGFGDVLIGNSNAQVSTLTNSGDASLVVSRVDVTGSAFSVNGLSLPFTLGIGKTATFSVTFSPTASGRISGSVSLVSNAANSPTSESLAGNGVSPVMLRPVDVSWDPSSSVVAGYVVYRTTQSGGPYERLNQLLVGATTFTDGSAQAGQTYFYVVTAVDSSAIESNFSSEVQISVPAA